MRNLRTLHPRWDGLWGWGRDNWDPRWDKKSIKSLSSGLGELCRRQGGKSIRARGTGGHHKNNAFRTQQDWHTPELTEAVAACTGPTQVQGRWGSSAKRRKWTCAPIHNQEITFNWQPLAEETLFSYSGISHWVYKPHLRAALYPAGDAERKWAQGYFCRFFLSSFALFEHFFKKVLLIFCLYIMVCNLCLLWVLNLHICICVYVCGAVSLFYHSF